MRGGAVRNRGGAPRLLRKGGKTSVLSAEGTVQKTLALLATDRHLERLLKVADSEPPRARPLFGAHSQRSLGENWPREPVDAPP
jgi:hypothetical protein